MAGYAANTRLQGAAPQFALTGQPGRGASEPAATEPFPPNEHAGGIDLFDLVGHPIDERFGDWFASLGESWSQLTFFLFDPESWR